MIKQFQGEYRWLSNFWVSPMRITIHQFPISVTAKTVEHLFQACKTLDEEQFKTVINCTTPSDAKRMGRTVTLRDDWDDIKIDVMCKALKSKFNQNAELKQKLIDTGDEHIQEGNYWHDTFWGVDLKTDEGQNHLGKLLMELRTQYKEK